MVALLRKESMSFEPICTSGKLPSIVRVGFRDLDTHNLCNVLSLSRRPSQPRQMVWPEPGPYNDDAKSVVYFQMSDSDPKLTLVKASRREMMEALQDATQGLANWCGRAVRGRAGLIGA